MKNAAFLGLVASAGLAANASAQPIGTATYSIAFGSPTGPSVIGLNPGQTIAVFVNVSINPGIGATIGAPPGSVLGLSDGGFNLSVAGTGSFSNLALDPPYNFPLGTSVGTPSGPNVNGVLWGVGFLLSPVHPSPNNPDTVWSGTYTAGASNSTLSFSNITPTGVFYGGPIPSVALYNSIGTIGLVAPAPTAAALLAFAGLAAARRRRNPLLPLCAPW